MHEERLREGGVRKMQSDNTWDKKVTTRDQYEVVWGSWSFIAV